MSRSIRLRVDGWSKTRFGLIEGNLVMFEVMWMGCACPTCIARLKTIARRMEQSELKWKIALGQIPERESSPSAILVVETPEVPEKVDAFLTELLGLQVSQVA